MTAPLTATFRVVPRGTGHVVERRVTGSDASALESLWHEIHRGQDRDTVATFAAQATIAFSERNPGAVAYLLPLASEPARQIVRAYDPEREPADPGCIECTLGTVPRHRETGLCLVHEAEFTLRRAQRDRSARSHAAHEASFHSSARS